MPTCSDIIKSHLRYAYYLNLLLTSFYLSPQKVLPPQKHFEIICTVAEKWTASSTKINM